ncbi:MAG: hypothetical protein AB1646_02645 [Thermodesulfobacteriota bacterium]
MEIEPESSAFDMQKVLIGLLRILKSKGALTEAEALDILWDAKDPFLPWSKRDIKDLFKL